MSDTSASRIRIGVAGWSYPDWAGIVYPKPKPRGFSELKRIASWFDMVEINASFYRTPKSTDAERWVSQVADFPDFRFAAKLNQTFTHERNLEPGATRDFQGFLEPLQESGRLVALLVQFPWSFRATAPNWLYIQRLREAFARFPLAVEFRHDAWWHEHWFSQLRAEGLSLVNIDQPSLEHNIPPGDVLTGPLAYVRLHGRNAQQWWADPQPYYGARYDYLYSPEEMTPWVERVTRMAIEADNTVVVFNNHHRGDAIVGAMEFAQMLNLSRGVVPATLREKYPEHYHRIHLPIEPPPLQQGDLFG